MSIEKDKEIYNYFHLQSKLQNKVISKNNFTYYFLIKIINKYLQKGGIVLDVGCGVGTIDLFLAKQGFFVEGIDVSKKAIKTCNENAKRNSIVGISFLCGDIQNSNLKQNHYNYIICNEVLEHIKEDKKIIEKITYALKPNGVAIISVPSSNAPLYKLGMLSKFDKKVGHLRRYSIKEINKLTTNSGLKLIETLETEGLLRNSLFVFNNLSWIIKFIKGPFVYFFHLTDDFFRILFGSSNIYVIAQKP